jgi:rubrerythrin
VSSVVFKREDLEREWSDDKDLAGAIEFAIRKELDSILYYHEIKSFVEEHQHKMVDGIIAEERKHFVKLKGLQKSQK